MECLVEKTTHSNGTPLQYFCLENPMDEGAWKAVVHGVTKSRTLTERLHFHFSLSCTGEGNGNPLQCSCLENPRDGGAWWPAICGAAQSRTQLKWLSSSSMECLELQERTFNFYAYHIWLLGFYLNHVGQLLFNLKKLDDVLNMKKTPFIGAFPLQ